MFGVCSDGQPHLNARIKWQNSKPSPKYDSVYFYTITNYNHNNHHITKSIPQPIPTWGESKLTMLAKYAMRLNGML